MSTLDIRTLLPHSGRSVLLDRLVAAEPDELTAEVTIRDDAPYLENGGVGAWIGLEFMAQAAAALAGWQAREEGGPVRQGVLLGTRRYECDRPNFPLGSVLRVTARRSARGDAELSVYECRISGEGVNASATISIYHGAGDRDAPRGRWRMTERALVTGSSRGIGRAIALRLAQDGYDIALHCRSRRDAADAVAREIAAMGRSACILQFDVTDRDDRGGNAARRRGSERMLLRRGVQRRHRARQIVPRNVRRRVGRRDPHEPDRASTMCCNR